jgi:hypothetical protein
LLRSLLTSIHHRTLQWCETATPLTLEREFVFEWSYYLDPNTDWANMKAFIQQNFGKGAATNLDVAGGAPPPSVCPSGMS